MLQNFLNSNILYRKPARLLLVATGNITNPRLIALFEIHLDRIIAALAELTDNPPLGGLRLVRYWLDQRPQEALVSRQRESDDDQDANLLDQLPLGDGRMS